MDYGVEVEGDPVVQALVAEVARLRLRADAVDAAVDAARATLAADQTLGGREAVEVVLTALGEAMAAAEDAGGVA